MSKKAGATDEEGPVILGRPSNHVKIGIVGLPNVGKSSFFNLVCKMQVQAENFPFCTIEATDSRVPVPDRRFDQLVKVHKPKKVIPAVLTITDIAGLVRGAHEGAGLGNAFLADITATDAIFHMVRTFRDAEVTHVDGSVDPVRDLTTINNELLQKDLGRAQAMVDGKRKNVERGVGGKPAKEEFVMLEKFLACLKNTKHIRYGKWNAKEVALLNQLQFLTAKTQVVLINCTKKIYITKRSGSLVKVKEYIDKEMPDARAMPFSIQWEQEYFDADEAGKAAMEETDGVKSAFPQIIKLGYSALKLQYFFTAGPQEVRAWTIRKGTKAPQAAGVIHTDFEKGFQSADIYSFKALKQNNLDEKAVKAAGLCRMQGKNYAMQDGDIVHFNCNTGKKKK
jgi:obg-like ATPase 1